MLCLLLLLVSSHALNVNQVTEIVEKAHKEGVSVSTLIDEIRHGEASTAHVHHKGPKKILDKKLKSRVAEQEQEAADLASGVTIGKMNGKAQAPSGQGDATDMVHPFYRYSTRMEHKGLWSGKQLSSFTVAKDTYFWNAKETAQCMKDKYVLFLGDSTLLENLNDLTLLLAGGPSKMPVGQMYLDFAQISAHRYTRYDTPNGVLQRTNAWNRNMTMKMEAINTEVRFRFLGAVNLTDNCKGLKTILTEEVKKEVDLLVENGGRKPDAIVIQSASHDMCNSLYGKNHLESFFGAIDQVGSDYVKKWSQEGIKVIWRGNARFLGEDQTIDNPKVKNDMRYPKKMDDTAQKVITANGGKFIDVSDTLAHYHDETGCCKTIGSATTTFPHLGSVSVRQFSKASAFYSQLVTYKILDNICPK